MFTINQYWSYPTIFLTICSFDPYFKFKEVRCLMILITIFINLSHLFFKETTCFPFSSYSEHEIDYSEI
jgi:hypothetical protein